MTSKILTISPSPHVYDNVDTKKLMYGVIIALIPALIVSIIFFGLGAIRVTLTAVVCCLIFEYLIQKFIFKGDTTINDGSAVVSGVLLAFNLPSSIPCWMVITGSLVTIGIAKMSFGGLGKNPFNPALVGRVFLLISFPVQMTSWPIPEVLHFSFADAVTGATVLGTLKEGIMQGHSVPDLMGRIPNYLDLSIGNLGGSLGEVSAFAIILGGIYMLIRKIITWHIPISFIGTVFIFTGILWLINDSRFIDPIFHLTSGGVMLGAIFMATDMVTSPMSKSGMLVFGFGCGILTTVIRLFGAYPEGVSFAILIMNACVPLIDRVFKPKRFGVS